MALLRGSAIPAGGASPFFTIAIPQYNRRRYLEENLRSVFTQHFEDFEILVSDDCSTDDSREVIPGLLERSGRVFRYYFHERNTGYDANIRFCLREARGRYVLMLGNDDALAERETLSKLASAIQLLGHPQLLITNVQDWESGQVSKRAYSSRILGSGPNAAIHYFRSFSFTSGLIFEGSAARSHETDKWDRSIYYQIYLACRILAAGGRLGGIDQVTIRDHIRLEGKLVPETYRNRFKGARFSMQARHTGLDSVARVTLDAIAPYVSASEQSRLVRRIYQQLLTITYPFWLFEYRAVANWGYAFGVARDLWPPNQLRRYPIGISDSCAIWAIYLLVTVAGLCVPAFMFNGMRNIIADSVRRLRQKVVI